MNNKFLPSVVAGFAAGVLLSIPILQNAFIIIIPAAIYFALFLDVRLNKAEFPVKRNTALLFGLLTGLWAAFFSTLFNTIFTYISHTNDFVESFPELLQWMKSVNAGKFWNDFIAVETRMYNDIRLKGFSPLYTYFLLIGNFFFYVLFGLIGALIARIYLNRKRTEQ